MEPFGHLNLYDKSSSGIAFKVLIYEVHSNQYIATPYTIFQNRLAAALTSFICIRITYGFGNLALCKSKDCSETSLTPTLSILPLFYTLLQKAKRKEIVSGTLTEYRRVQHISEICCIAYTFGHPHSPQKQSKSRSHTSNLVSKFHTCGKCNRAHT